MMWWIDPDDEIEPPPLPKITLDWDQKYCRHEWKPVVLIISVVHDCAKCGVKKEIYDEWEKDKF